MRKRHLNRPPAEWVGLEMFRQMKRIFKGQSVLAKIGPWTKWDLYGGRTWLVRV
jgi:hypothetical protein